ncbi:MAG: hypothetical protein ACUZ8I_07340 [Candidatus Scalindua sp.]
MTRKIPNKKLVELYCKMMAKLNVAYPRNFWRWLGIFHRDLDKELTVADDNINKVWTACLEGRANLMGFLGGVKVYEGLVVRGFGLYNTAQRKLQ